MTDFDIAQPYRYRNGEEVFRTLATDLPGQTPFVTVTKAGHVKIHISTGAASPTWKSPYDLVNIPAPKPALPWPLFMPAIGDPYWTYYDGVVFTARWNDSDTDRARAALNLVFPTEAAATAHLQRMLDEAEIRRIVAEHNGDWVWVPGHETDELQFGHMEMDLSMISTFYAVAANPIIMRPGIFRVVRPAILSAIPLDRVARVFGGV